MKRLEGRVALVTGAGAGIGLETARLFAREGAHVFVSDIDQDAAIEAVDNITADGFAATALGGDVTNADEVDAIMTAIKAAFGKLDILINNAGLTVRADFRHMSDDEWDKVWETNLQGTIRCMRQAFSLLQASGNGAIVNLSSIMATRHTRQMSHYSATKGAVTALSRNVAVEYAPYNIRVNYLCPGFIETKLTDRYTRNPMIAKVLINQTPLRRFGTALDVAKAALFLASDDAAFITGAGLAVDGGMGAGL